MSGWQTLLDRLHPAPTDVVGIDITPDGVAAVRMKKGAKDSAHVLAADMLPALAMPAADADDAAVPPIDLPPALKAKYASIVYSGAHATVKFLSFPGPFDTEQEEKLVQNLGLTDAANFRIGYRVVTRGHGKAESRVVAVAMPELEAHRLVSTLPSGIPAPLSLEVSDLATLTAFLRWPGVQHDRGAFGVVAFGFDSSTFALFNEGNLVLIRRFDIGLNAFLSSVQRSLGVDHETARGILTDGSFDISQSVTEVLDPLTKQMVLSREFVERRENCHVQRLYVSGDMAASHDVMEELRAALGVETLGWNPFDGLPAAREAFTERVAGREWRFSAAIGACLGTFEET